MRKLLLALLALPFTQTGVLATYTLNDKITIDAGITRGWNQSINDNNGNCTINGRTNHSREVPSLNTYKRGQNTTGFISRSGGKNYRAYD